MTLTDRNELPADITTTHRRVYHPQNFSDQGTSPRRTALPTRHNPDRRPQQCLNTTTAATAVHHGPYEPRLRESSDQPAVFPVQGVRQKRDDFFRHGIEVLPRVTTARRRKIRFEGDP